jgi:hypothetical protein
LHLDAIHLAWCQVAKVAASSGHVHVRALPHHQLREAHKGAVKALPSLPAPAPASGAALRRAPVPRPRRCKAVAGLATVAAVRTDTAAAAGGGCPVQRRGPCGRAVHLVLRVHTSRVQPQYWQWRARLQAHPVHNQACQRHTGAVSCQGHFLNNALGLQ